MNKKQLLFVVLILSLFFAIQSVSAYHYNDYGSRGYYGYDDWDAYNQYLDDRVVHNRMYDYFKYGSPWQGDVVVDLTYSYPPHYSVPRYVERPMNYYGNQRHRGYYDGYRRDYGNYNSGYYGNCY